MITPAWVAMMAAYNAEMNRRLYAAAGRLTDEERRRDRGAFWRSIHGTFSHLVWADRTWMSRFAGWERPAQKLAESDRFAADFAALAASRIEADAGISTWAAQLDPAWLAGDQTWFSGAAGHDMIRPRMLLVTHFFNHQTHHRGQAHAMLTAAGERTGDTDLQLVLPA
ncbi:MAG: damage-inducible protein DinB [Alphaproteobacteria bacterium]|nr:damage-inducible protein DinB [Alphaproteobacteria bacterium]